MVDKLCNGIFGVEIASEISERFAESSEDLLIDTSFWRLAEVVSTWDEYVIHLFVQYRGAPQKSDRYRCMKWTPHH